MHEVFISKKLYFLILLDSFARKVVLRYDKRCSRVFEKFQKHSEGYTQNASNIIGDKRTQN